MSNPDYGSLDSFYRTLRLLGSNVCAFMASASLWLWATITHWPWLMASSTASSTSMLILQQRSHLFGTVTHSAAAHSSVTLDLHFHLEKIMKHVYDYVIVGGGL